MGPQRLTVVALFALASLCIHGAVLEGIVLEQHTGQPLEQVRVEAAGAPAAVITNGEGRFRLSTLKPGRFRLTLSCEGYASVVVAGTLTADLQVVARLPRNGAIAGQVRDARGQPVSRARVVPLHVGGGDQPPLPLTGRATSTDDRGRYRLFGLPPGGYLVAAGAPGSEPATLDRTLTILSGDELGSADLTVSWQPPRTVTGRVQIAENAKPFLLRLAPVAAPFLTAAEALTGTDGAFRMENVPAGLYRLYGMGPSLGNGGFGGILGPNPLYARDVEEIDLRVGDAVRDNLAAAPAPPTSFALQSDCATSGTLQLSATEDWGTRTTVTVDLSAAAPTAVADLPPARYGVTLTGVKPGCYYTGPAWLDRTQAPPESHKLEVGAAAALDGQLIGPAREQAAMVLLWPQEPSADGPAAVYLLPDANGAFAVDDLPPGRYRLRWAEGKSWQAGPWKPEAKNGTELELPAGGTTRVELP